MTILSCFLQSLGVPHTVSYSDGRFHAMTFQSLFGLSKVLEDYHVPTEALRLNDKTTDLDKLTPPFLAHTRDCFAIVEAIGPDEIVCTGYDGTAKTMSRDRFMTAWDGIVMLAYPQDNSAEPDYAVHRVADFARTMRPWIIGFAALFLFAYFYITNGLWHNIWSNGLILVTLVGLYVTFQLELKTLGIHTAAADSICGVIDRGGCNSILETPASKFLGIFSWSEIGLAYFSVSLAAMVIFPSSLGWLALINALCCPYSLWSVWYQKFRAHKWCTLCLITQVCLWLSQCLYIVSGAWSATFPLGWGIAVLIAAYALVFMTLNMLNPYLTRK
ncbi:MAG: hypothetical protein K2M68_09560 [Muribaculaceae bacterium]|nr:hypothetical protein [Muribaculaceae bacterium]